MCISVAGTVDAAGLVCVCVCVFHDDNDDDMSCAFVLCLRQNVWILYGDDCILVLACRFVQEYYIIDLICT